MAMQQLNYGAGALNGPREGDMRTQWVAAEDAIDYQVYRDGRWQLQTRLHRRDLQQAAIMNVYQPYPRGNQNPLYQGAMGGLDAAYIFTTTNPSPEAIARAETLLLSHLNPQQVTEFRGAGAFMVIGGATGRRYRISKECWPGKNVTWMENGKARISYGAYPAGQAYLPVGDVMLAQKLALEDPDGESRFTTMACWTDHVSGGGGGNGVVYGVRHGHMYIDNRNADIYALRAAPLPAGLGATIDDDPAPIFFVLCCALAMFAAFLLLR